MWSTPARCCGARPSGEAFWCSSQVCADPVKFGDIPDAPCQTIDTDSLRRKTSRRGSQVRKKPFAGF